AFAGTLAYGINASGQVVGSYNDNIGGGTHGFLYSGGTYTTLDVPDAGANGTTVAQSINGLGQIAGYYNNGAGIAFGFIQLGSNHYRPSFLRTSTTWRRRTPSTAWARSSANTPRTASPTASSISQVYSYSSPWTSPQATFCTA